MSTKVAVTQEHIDKAKELRRDGYTMGHQCPIAFALKELLKPEFVISVNGSTFDICNKPEGSDEPRYENIVYTNSLSTPARNLAANFDKRLSVAPIEFYVKIDSQYLK